LHAVDRERINEVMTRTNNFNFQLAHYPPRETTSRRPGFPICYRALKL
jgi:hypothetical protein